MRELSSLDLQLAFLRREGGPHGVQPLVQLLLDSGCNANAADYDKRTCLHLAASEGIVPIVEFLLDANADINCADRWGGTPLRDAVREGHRKVAAILKERGGHLGGDVPSISEAQLNALLSK